MNRVDIMLGLLHASGGYRDGNPGRDHITGQEHALRCAALGEQVSGELGFIGLVHDLGRPLSEEWHGEVMAEIVRDRVSADAYHVLRTHGEFQTALNHGLPWPYEDAPWYRTARRFVGIEVRSFANECREMALADAERLIRVRLG